MSVHKMFLSPEVSPQTVCGANKCPFTKTLPLNIVEITRMAKIKQQDEFPRRSSEISAVCTVTMCHKSARGHKAPIVGEGNCNNEKGS
jgi:hypothetical protein